MKKQKEEEKQQQREAFRLEKQKAKEVKKNETLKAGLEGLVNINVMFIKIINHNII